MIDDLLDQLMTHSQVLADGAQASASDTWRGTLEQRSALAEALAEAAKAKSLSPEQLARLRNTIELGDKARFPIAAKRENLRVQIMNLRDSRRSQQALKPYRRSNGRRLNVSG